MPTIEISRAGDQEREWTAALLSDSEPWLTLGVTLEQCRASCLNPEYQVFVARSGRRLCGAIVVHPHGVAGSPYIKSIAVSEDSRGAGVGGLLMDFAEGLARTESRHIFLCVSSFNTRARTFYERRGYRAVGEFVDYIVEGASETLMYKRLR